MKETNGRDVLQRDLGVRVILGGYVWGPGSLSEEVVFGQGPGC